MKKRALARLWPFWPFWRERCWHPWCFRWITYQYRCHLHQADP